MAGFVAAGMAVISVGWFLRGQPDVSPPTGQSSQLVRIGAERADGQWAVDLGANDAPNLAIVAEARLENPMVHWEFRGREASEILESGIIQFSSSDSSLREIVVLIPKAKLQAASYWLVLLDDERNVIRQWQLHVR